MDDPLLDIKIGPYRTRMRLGSGGNGDVYAATRETETHQMVAIKFLRFTDLGNEESRHRFLREAKILALLSHPYVVKLFDADKTKDRLPYFVMEFVHGRELNAYANSNRLTVTSRLHLFLKICEAVQYLHTHLIIHRDLKPANLMVTDDGIPKVLDFGIAKLIKPELLDGEMLTTHGQSPCTLEYASPEQWEGQTITTGSDVYTLGVILYLLLTGNLPISSKGRTAGEYGRLVHENNLPAASENLVDKHFVACQASSANSLKRTLQGDLDHILAKALNRDLNIRYTSVGALMEDINRHLQSLPVQARKGVLSYRLKRFLWRNRILMASIAAVIVALTIALIAALNAWHTNQRENATLHYLLDKNQKAKADLNTARDNLQAGVADARTNLQSAIQLIEESNKEIRVQLSQTRGEETPEMLRGHVVLAGNYAGLAKLMAATGDQAGAQQASGHCLAEVTYVKQAGDSEFAGKADLVHCQ